jgi:hypothetical protein
LLAPRFSVGSAQPAKYPESRRDDTVGAEKLPAKDRAGCAGDCDGEICGFHCEDPFLGRTYNSTADITLQNPLFHHEEPPEQTTDKESDTP